MLPISETLTGIAALGGGLEQSHECQFARLRRPRRERRIETPGLEVVSRGIAVGECFAARHQRDERAREEQARSADLGEHGAGSRSGGAKPPFGVLSAVVVAFPPPVAVVVALVAIALAQPEHVGGAHLGPP